MPKMESEHSGSRNGKCHAKNGMCAVRMPECGKGKDSILEGFIFGSPDKGSSDTNYNAAS
jgi:hypothetical protein